MGDIIFSAFVSFVLVACGPGVSVCAGFGGRGGMTGSSSIAVVVECIATTGLSLSFLSLSTFWWSLLILKVENCGDELEPDKVEAVATTPLGL